MTDNAGTQTDSYQYEAYGKATQTGTTPNHYQYTGEQYDADIDQTYLRARYYNQNIGRFHTLDSFRGFNNNPLSLNKYNYGHSDPVGNVDWSGMSTDLTISGTAISSSIWGALARQLVIGSSVLCSAININAKINPEASPTGTNCESKVNNLRVHIQKYKTTYPYIKGRSILEDPGGVTVLAVIDLINQYFSEMRDIKFLGKKNKNDFLEAIEKFKKKVREMPPHGYTGRRVSLISVPIKNCQDCRIDLDNLNGTNLKK